MFSEVSANYPWSEQRQLVVALFHDRIFRFMLISSSINV